MRSESKCSVATCDYPLDSRGFCTRHYMKWRHRGFPPLDEFLADPDPKRVYVPVPLAERFWQKVQQTEGCWLWTGWRGPGGYGELRLVRGSVRVRAHRISWELHFGAIPHGMFVCHKCDNPPCVRPDHLFLGTHADNVRDMAAKGRRGNTSGKPYKGWLTPEAVRTIRTRYAEDGISRTQLATEFNISRSQASRIISRARWSNV